VSSSERGVSIPDREGAVNGCPRCVRSLPGWHRCPERLCHPAARGRRSDVGRQMALAAVLVLALAPTVSAQSGCLAPDDTSAGIVSYVTVILTDTGQAAMSARDRLGIGGVKAGQIAPVTDSRICSRIVDFFDHFEGVRRSARSVYAYSIGPTRVVAQDPSFKSGEWTPLMFLDHTYKLVHMVF